MTFAPVPIDTLSRSRNYRCFLDRIESKPTPQFVAFFVTDDKSVRRICPILHSHTVKLILALLENPIDACPDAFFGEKRRIFLEAHNPFHDQHLRALFS
jgi:hypothetical protein